LSCRRTATRQTLSSGRCSRRARTVRLPDTSPRFGATLVVGRTRLARCADRAQKSGIPAAARVPSNVSALADGTVKFFRPPPPCRSRMANSLAESRIEARLRGA
jgi:hypothetical protein